jgi:hypothetical protein
VCLKPAYRSNNVSQLFELSDFMTLKKQSSDTLSNSCGIILELMIEGLAFIMFPRYLHEYNIHMIE